MAFLFLKFILTILALLFHVLGAPVQTSPTEKPSLITWAGDSGFTLHNYGYQGDGLYRAYFNNAGIATVKFTSFEALDQASTNAASNSTERIEARHHSGRPTHVVCSLQCFPPSDNVASEMATNALADYFGPGYHMERANMWAWVFSGKHVAFACTYSDDQWFSANLVRESMHIVDGCGSSCYGFNSIQQDYKIALVSDASIGRTFKGDHFCDKHFKGF